MQCQACMALSHWQGTANVGGPQSLTPTSQNFNLTLQSSNPHHGAPAKEHWQYPALGAATGKMDPLSISASCFALVGGIAKATVAVVEFTRDVRHANEDLDAIAAALQFLGTILTPFATSLPILKAIPLELMQRVDAILKGCATAVEQIDKNVTKYRKNKVFAKIGWIVSGQAEMQKLRRDLEGYKSMLHLGLQVISMYEVLPVSSVPCEGHITD